MNMYAKEKVSESRIVTHFVKSVRMSTYLVAYVVTDFKHLKTTTGKYNNITVRTSIEVMQTDCLSKNYACLDELSAIICVHAEVQNEAILGSITDLNCSVYMHVNVIRQNCMLQHFSFNLKIA